MKKFEILLACMHQKDTSIVGKSNIHTDVVVVNQCDEEKIEEEQLTDKHGNLHGVKFVCTKERGLSRSRNKALEHSDAEICLISDDDEFFHDDVSERIIENYDKHPEADVILFQVDGAKPSYPSEEFYLGKIAALRICSVQISFRRKPVMDNNIRFDVEMGSGTGHGSCEEVHFIYQCLRAKLKVLYVPVEIAKLDPESKSQWFSGFDHKFFFNRGWATRRFMGRFWATLYAVYYTVKKHGMYKKDSTLWAAFKWTMKGIAHKNYPEKK